MRPKIVLVARLGILLAIATCTEPQEPTVPRPIGGATADVVGSDPVVVGAWHIVVLNSSGDPNVSTADGSPQVQWLKADLAANTSYCTLAIWHHSRFYSPLSTSDPGVDDDTKPLWVALYNAGADVALTGHEHQYERFAPQDNDGNLDPQTGLRSFVVRSEERRVGKGCEAGYAVARQYE